MKRKKQSDVSFERLNKSMTKENLPDEGLENLLLSDIKRLLNCYFVYQNDDLRYLFSNNLGSQEFSITLKYRRFKDIKIL
ncbi:MAG: hypothetical protein IJD50_01515 [Clostridia bacterium]|nr:hypothetical protein [Clostridia bacterium]